ncbi:MAG: hypothetical protein AAGH57_08090 [Pseudomonadota bacterium]
MAAQPPSHVLSRPIANALAPLAAMALSACDASAQGEAGPGAISEGEERALNEAAKMLDEQRLPQGALPEVNQPGMDPPQAGETEPSRAAPE